MIDRAKSKDLHCFLALQAFCIINKYSKSLEK